MTAVQIAREYFPSLPEREIEYLLRNATGFPWCGETHLRRQLARLAEIVRMAHQPPETTRHPAPAPERKPR